MAALGSLRKFLSGWFHPQHRIANKHPGYWHYQKELVYAGQRHK